MLNFGFGGNLKEALKLVRTIKIKDLLQEVSN